MIVYVLCWAVVEFERAMRGVERYDICRLFLATLQLVSFNTYALASPPILLTITTAVIEHCTHAMTACLMLGGCCALSGE